MKVMCLRDVKGWNGIKVNLAVSEGRVHQQNQLQKDLLEIRLLRSVLKCIKWQGEVYGESKLEPDHRLQIPGNLKFEVTDPEILFTFDRSWNVISKWHYYKTIRCETTLVSVWSRANAQRELSGQWTTSTKPDHRSFVLLMNQGQI